MVNIYDYMDWRGDISLQHGPLNEVDSLIFSWLAYVEWGNVAPPPGAGAPLPLAEAAARFFEAHPQPEPKAAYAAIPAVAATALLARAAQCPRYQEVTLCGFVEEWDEQTEKQFAALTFLWGEEAFIAYRGTDTTFIGWKEDFFLCLSEAVPAQLAALDYLDRIPQLPGKRLYLGGHSKGGNLAVYAGVKCAPQWGMHIEKIYNFDGPGFPLSFIQHEDYMRMLPRIFTFIPQGSVVGLLLEHREAHTILKSAQIGLLQHLSVYWEVKGPSFVREKEVSNISVLLDKTLKEWLNALTDEEKREFIQVLFSLLFAAKAERIEELGPEDFVRALRALAALESQEKGMLLRAVLLLLKAGNSALYQAITSPGAEWIRQGQQKLLSVTERLREAVEKIWSLDEEDHHMEHKND